MRDEKRKVLATQTPSWGLPSNLGVFLLWQIITNTYGIMSKFFQWKTQLRILLWKFQSLRIIGLQSKLFYSSPWFFLLLCSLWALFVSFEWRVSSSIAGILIYKHKIFLLFSHSSGNALNHFTVISLFWWNDHFVISGKGEMA